MELTGAAGAVREGVGAVHNLTALLRSPRVGSRALTRALPALRDGMAHLVGALADFEAALAEQLVTDSGGRTAAAALLARAKRQGDELVRELDSARPVDARARLALEARVSRLGAGLDDVLALADLLVAAGTPRNGEMDLHDLLVDRWQGRPSGSVATWIDVPPKTALVGDARVLGTLADIAVRRVASGSAAARLRMERGTGGAPMLVVTPADASSLGSVVVHVSARPLAPEVFEVARAAARLAGMDLRGEHGAAAECTLHLSSLDPTAEGPLDPSRCPSPKTSSP